MENYYAHNIKVKYTLLLIYFSCILSFPLLSWSVALTLVDRKEIRNYISQLFPTQGKNSCENTLWKALVKLLFSRTQSPFGLDLKRFSAYGISALPVISSGNPMVTFFKYYAILILTFPGIYWSKSIFFLCWLSPYHTFYTYIQAS